MSQPSSQPQPRRTAIRALGAVGIVAGAGVVATLLLYPRVRDLLAVRISGNMSTGVPTDWQPATQPASQPASQAAASQSATQPLKVVPMPGTLPAPATTWRCEAGTPPAK